MDQRAFADVGVPACKTITTTSNKRKTKKVALRHVSWSQVLAEAVLQKGFSGVADPEQAWILGELIRYLEHRKGAGLDVASTWPRCPPSGR